MPEQDICPCRILSTVLGEAEGVNRDLLLKEKVTIIWLQMKTTCFGFTLGRGISWRKVAVNKDTENGRKVSKSLEEWGFGTAYL